VKGRTALIAAALALAGCGGSSSKPLSQADLSKLDGAESQITGFCVAGATSAVGGQLGQLAAAVDDVIDLYKSHGNVAVQLTPIAPKRPFKDVIRQMQDELGTGGCAPDQAAKLDDAVH
jgi:ABC-type glycerol-3-phosphate transport system substrate-binding protein